MGAADVFRTHSPLRGSFKTPWLNLPIVRVPFPSVPPPGVPPPPMEPAATMEPPAETCPAAGGKGPRVAAVIEAAERAGMHAVRSAVMKGAAAAGVTK